MNLVMVLPWIQFSFECYDSIRIQYMEKNFRACITGLMYMMLEQDQEKGRLRERKQFGGRDYREINYWVQTNFLLAMYIRSS